MDKEDVVHTYNGIRLSHKKNEIMPSAATWMALKIIILNEIGQKEKDEYHMISVIHGVRLLMERLSCRVLPQRDPIYPSMNGLWVYKLSYI